MDNRILRATLAILFVALTAAINVPSEYRDASGLAVVSRAAPAQPLSEPLAVALSEAWDFAAAHPDVVGYPWADRQTGELVLSSVTAEGDRVLRQWRLTNTAAAAVPRRFRQVASSWGALERIKHDATFLEKAGVVDADAIFETVPDGENNRVIIGVSRRSDALFAALAARYGTTTIAIRIEAGRSGGLPAGRDDDRSPFFGGANVGCTTGFSFTGSRMVSAGHCWPQPNGGSVSTPVAFMGTVAGWNTNWSPGTGTVMFSGDSIYRGDLARIDIQNGQTSWADMYTGGVGSYSYAPVRELWYRAPVKNDQFCTGGRASGETCAWGVNWDFPGDHRYASGEYVRNGWEGIRWQGCIQQGDSGGPIYTVRGDGGIAAKGIISGQDSFLGWCYVYFTDLRLANAWWPGLNIQ